MRDRALSGERLTNCAYGRIHEGGYCDAYGLARRPGGARHRRGAFRRRAVSTGVVIGRQSRGGMSSHALTVHGRSRGHLHVLSAQRLRLRETIPAECARQGDHQQQQSDGTKHVRSGAENLAAAHAGIIAQVPVKRGSQSVYHRRMWALPRPVCYRSVTLRRIPLRRVAGTSATRKPKYLSKYLSEKRRRPRQYSFRALTMIPPRIAKAAARAVTQSAPNAQGRADANSPIISSPPIRLSVPRARPALARATSDGAAIVLGSVCNQSAR